MGIRSLSGIFYPRRIHHRRERPNPLLPPSILLYRPGGSDSDTAEPNQATRPEGTIALRTAALTLPRAAALAAAAVLPPPGIPPLLPVV